MLRWLPEDVSPYGAGIDSLFYFIYYLTAVAFIVVTALMIIFLYVYRDQGGRRATYTHGNTALEIIWTIIPAMVFIGLGLFSRSLWEDIKLAPPETDTVVKVTGKQFNWEIVYPGPDGEFNTADDKQVDNDIRVPAGKPVRVILTSKDVIHSFFLPNLRFKQDAVPGREIIGWFQANKPGKYEVPCAELCGFGHSGMKGWLYALAPDEYQAWQNEEWPQTASSNGPIASPKTAAASPAVATERVQEVVSEAAVQESAETVQNTGTGAADAVQSAVAEVQEAAPETVQESLSTAQAAGQAAIEAAQGATAAAAPAREEAGEAGQAVQDASQDTAEEDADSAQGAIQDAVEAAQAAPEAVQDTAITSAEEAAIAAETAEETATDATQEAPAEGSSSEASPSASDQESSADASSAVSLKNETSSDSPKEYAFTPAAEPGEICQGELKITSGATIYELAQKFYQETKILLGVDLIRDYNTHIVNLDHIYPGQKLCIPSLSRATRLRHSKESGSYNLILDSFRSTRKANALIRQVEQKGYEALLTNRQVSDSLLLKRVEITGLQDQTAANQAWTMFTPANAEDLS